MTLAAVPEISHMPLVEGRVAYWLLFLGLVILCCAWWRNDGLWDQLRKIVMVLKRRVTTHDEQLAGISAHLEILDHFLGIEVHPPVLDDSPGHEAELYDEPATDEFPAVTSPDIPVQKPTPFPRDLPDTVESHAVIVGGVRLAPAAQAARDELEELIVAIRKRTEERMAWKPETDEAEAS